MTFPYTAAEAGNQFPAMTYVVNSLTASLTLPLNPRKRRDFRSMGRLGDRDFWA
jgi:hypothetical protein